MNWRPGDCRSGDVIRVDLGGFYHVGIFVSEQEVIQFGLPPVPENKGKPLVVLQTDIDAFACGRIVEVAQTEKGERPFSPGEIVSRARARLGEGGYNLIHNNCEHFAMECAFGVKRCALEEDARRRWRNRPILDVFLAPIDRQGGNGSVFSPARAKEIVSCKNPAVRQDKTAVWNLLQTALYKTFGLDAKTLDFSQNRYGKWLCEDAYFSLSHSGDWAAVAVSNKPVGVDIELPALFEDRYVSRTGKTEALRKKAYTAREKREDNDSPDDFLIKWTRKEAIFKHGGTGSFRPHKIESDDPLTITRSFSEPENMIVSVCGEHSRAARFYLWRNDAITLLSAVNPAWKV